MASRRALLIVEDEADLAFLLAANFRGEGYEVRVAKNGLAGLKLARKHKPDLIISDVMMPLMNGHEMIRLLRKESAVPVLFLTAKNDESDRVRVQLDGDEYMTKPFSMNELIRRAQAMLLRGAPRQVAKKRRAVKRIER
ncbi:MAG: response regulator [Elusimicrobia bacterium]|nr:response regulator [Elusimicrobiota bacterium]